MDKGCKGEKKQTVNIHGQYKQIIMLVWSQQELYNRNHKGKFESK